MSKPFLYYVPPSFFSQVARLALAEKGIDYDSRYVIPGPPSFESYAPRYMQLNPGGTVPTLVHEGKVIPDSLDVLRYLETRFELPALSQGRAERAEIDRLVASLYAISFRELSYGSPLLLKLGIRINRKRVRNLRERLSQHPHLAAIYEAKIRDIETFSGNAQDDAQMRRARRVVADTLDQFDAALRSRRFLAGEEYSLADLVWTVGVARLTMISMKPLAKRPALERWYAQMKSRPSFRDAGVMERFQPSAVLRVLWAKFRGSFFGAVQNRPHPLAAGE
ncbi:MAG: glutathione S-transferase family protein [Hyphomicrobiales bacterium]|nr:glutathione S-transferase family protein [Hyphomicrobiales bacterium]